MKIVYSTVKLLRVVDITDEHGLPQVSGSLRVEEDVALGIGHFLSSVEEAAGTSGVALEVVCDVVAIGQTR